MKNEKNILDWFDFNQDPSLLNEVEDRDLFKKIAHYSSQITTPERDVEQGLADVLSRSTKKEIPVRSLEFTRLLRVAAVIVLMLLPAYFLFFNTTEYETGLAQTELITLPDNSEVILNAESELSLKKRSYIKDRKLELDGEAFFKVATGKSFMVKTDQGTVEVLGTQFNVAERDAFFEIKCFEGKVKVTHNNNDYILTKGKTFRFINGEIIEMEDFDESNPSWLSKESTFIEIPVYMVMMEIERQFDVAIDTKGLDLSANFTGGFKHNDLDAALKSVCLPLGLTYSIDGKNIALSTYE